MDNLRRFYTIVYIHTMQCIVSIWTIETSHGPWFLTKSHWNGSVSPKIVKKCLICFNLRLIFLLNWDVYKNQSLCPQYFFHLSLANILVETIKKIWILHVHYFKKEVIITPIVIFLPQFYSKITTLRLN